MPIRKKYIVDKSFQYGLILKNLVMLFFTFALIVAVLFVWEKYQTKQGFLIRLPQNSAVIAWAKENNVSPGSAEFMQQFIKMSTVYTFFDLLWKPLALVFALNLLILTAANIYYSNKIAGPIYRLKNELERKLNGEEVEPVFFRKNDAFHDLAVLINRFMDLQTSKAPPKTGIKE